MYIFHHQGSVLYFMPAATDIRNSVVGIQVVQDLSIFQLFGFLPKRKPDKINNTLQTGSSSEMDFPWQRLQKIAFPIEMKFLEMI